MAKSEAQLDAEIAQELQKLSTVAAKKAKAAPRQMQMEIDYHGRRPQVVTMPLPQMPDLAELESYQDETAARIMRGRTKVTKAAKPTRQRTPTPPITESERELVAQARESRRGADVLADYYETHDKLKQAKMWRAWGERPRPSAHKGEPNLASYSTVIIAFSGGKDSLACLLHVLDCGVPRERIELWHHDVDGQEGSTLMDWACTRDYCRKVAAAFGVPIYFSWKVGGFEREMLRNRNLTAPIKFETPDGIRTVGGITGNADGVRRKFPQVSADLSVRWCSAYLKIDVGSAALRNQARFNNTRTLMVTGERAEESTSRANYLVFEEDRADGRAGRAKRHVDHWRPVHAWSERDTWEIIERYRVTPHPAYRIGFGRVSCARCIFGSPDQWASTDRLEPAKLAKVANYEQEFGVTIQRKRNVRQLVVLGQPYRWSDVDARAAISDTFDEPVIMARGAWRLPMGAFGDSAGPT